MLDGIAIEMLGGVINHCLAKPLETGCIPEFEGIPSLCSLTHEQVVRWLAIRWKWDTSGLTVANVSRDDAVAIGRASVRYFADYELPLTIEDLRRAEQLYEFVRSIKPVVGRSFAVNLLLAFYVRDVLELDVRPRILRGWLRHSGMDSIDSVLEKEYNKPGLALDLGEEVYFKRVMDGNAQAVIAVVEKAREQVAERESQAAGSTSRQCFIATTVFENEDRAVVRVLRRFRDSRMKKCLAGKLAAALYERIGPTMARWLGSRRLCRRRLRKLLVVIAWRIRSDEW